jgi:nitrate/TMAO reductase-like tetraheme cytochrome c subunit
MKLRLPPSFHNWLSYSGTVISVISIFMFVFLFVLSSIAPSDKAYAGIVIFIVIPVFIILGLLLIPLGMILKIRRIKKHGASPTTNLPILNLNLPHHRNATIIFIVGTLVFFFLSALGSYEAYHFTESNRFCGTLCHNIMIPEYTAYQHSPHARVKCAECHIGSGANWYVKSKLSGLYQVYAAVSNTYPQPIPTPVKNLRPARDTCEECHWPQKIYGKNQRKEIYYLPNEENTQWEIDLLMNTGGGNPAMGQSSGIHWHINPDIEIEYISTDEKRLVIPKVFLKNKATGETIVFENEEEPFDQENAEHAENRVMDCIDCHNRPAHIYRDPSKFLNIAIAAGEIPTSLPMIKYAGIEACVAEYETTEEAMDGITNHIKSFYADNYPELATEKAADVEKAIVGIQKAFSKNIFPEMKVTWESYPDHIGHQTSPGCFRCHDGKHVSEDGQTITHECNDCHFITAQGPVENMEYAGKDPLEFKHPEDIGDDWQYVGCYECHSVPPI